MNKIFVITFLLILFSVSGWSQSKITAVKIGNKIDVTINKMFFTSYIFAENEKYPYFFPVNAPSGAGVTSMRNGV